MYRVIITEEEWDSGWKSKIAVFENDNQMPKYVLGREFIMCPTRELTYYFWRYGDGYPTILDTYELRGREVIDEIIEANTINHPYDITFDRKKLKDLEYRKRTLKFEDDAIPQIKNIEDLAFKIDSIELKNEIALEISSEFQHVVY